MTQLYIRNLGCIVPGATGAKQMIEKNKRICRVNLRENAGTYLINENVTVFVEQF